jgi:hypothetical protein
MDWTRRPPASGRHLRPEHSKRLYEHGSDTAATSALQGVQLKRSFELVRTVIIHDLELYQEKEKRRKADTRPKLIIF